jgi:hypothetical protein
VIGIGPILAVSAMFTTAGVPLGTLVQNNCRLMIQLRLAMQALPSAAATASFIVLRLDA